jgi:hypothetical protein
MTYGEFWFAIKMSMRMVDGKWIVYKPLKEEPKRMSREEASKYYGQKLKNYFETTYKKELENKISRRLDYDLKEKE